MMGIRMTLVLVGEASHILAFKPEGYGTMKATSSTSSERSAMEEWTRREAPERPGVSVSGRIGLLGKKPNRMFLGEPSYDSSMRQSLVRSSALILHSDLPMR